MFRGTYFEWYQLVKHHDRVGRLADTWEYSNVDFHPTDLIMNCLELKSHASNMFEQIDDHVIIKHVYIERRMIPLNVFIEKANEEKVDKQYLSMVTRSSN